MKNIVLLCLCVQIYAQSEYYLPWVPNNETFQSTIVITNLGASTLTVDLEATRTLSERESQTLTVDPFDSVRMPAVGLFTELGEGSGYAVKLAASSSRMAASCIVWSTTTASGESPSQMNAIPVADSTTALSFNFTQNGSGFSAPVVVNVGERSSRVTFQAYQAGMVVETTSRLIGRGGVFAEPIASMFPDVEGDFFVVAESSELLLGASFIFNDQLEPALVPGLPLDETNNPETALSSVFINPSNRSIDIGESVQLNVFGFRSLAGVSTELSPGDVTWKLSDPSLATLDEFGRVTGRKAGTLRVDAQFEEHTGSATINIQGPRLRLTFAQNCYIEDDNCSYNISGFYPGFQPISRFTVFNLSIAGQSDAIVGFFELEAIQQPFRISRVVARNSGGVQTSIRGLVSGQTIQPGQPVRFTCVSTLTRGATVDLEYIVEVEGIGPILNYTMEFTSN